jgi:hypothetical protein
MDPSLFKALFVLPLVGCQATPAQPTLHSLVAAADPVPELPERPDVPERDHPAHGEGATESPMYLGLGGYTNLRVSNTFARGVTVDSSASGSYASAASALWLSNNFPLAVSTRDLVEPFPPTTLPIASPGGRPNSKGHVQNLAVRRVTGSTRGHRE